MVFLLSFVLGAFLGGYVVYTRMKPATTTTVATTTAPTTAATGAVDTSDTH
jgi:hypothetical protein